MNYSQIMDIHAVCPVGPDLSGGRGIFKNSISMHSPIKYPRACKICFRSYSTKSSFSNHKKRCKPPSDDDSNKNNSSKYIQIMDIHAVCPVGPDLSGGRGTFKNSIFMRCPIKYPRACKICFRSYSTKSSFSNHKRYCKPPSDDDSNKNNFSTYICKTCNKSYATYSDVFKHNRICEKELNRKTYHPCPLPDSAAKFHHVSHINRHLTDSHGFQMNLLSEEHIRCPIKYPRECKICFRSYSTKSSFSNHKKHCKPPSDDDSNKNNSSTYIQIMDIHAVCPVGPDLSGDRGTFKNSVFMRCPIKYPRACKICFRSYCTKSSFSNHKRYCKPPSDDDSNKNKFSTYICKTCNKSCTTYSDVFKHNRICEKELNRKTSHPCPLLDCAAKFHRVSHINRHLADSHGFQMNLLSEEHKFKSMADFEFWLNTEEVKTCTSFKKSGSVIKNNKTYSYYVCHFYPRRVSKSVFLTEDNVKAKIYPNIMCPARVMVHEERECVKAIFYRRHNHEVFQKCEISTPETEL